MFKSPTVFIIGAGASCEAGLPAGTQLASTIAEKLNIRRTGLSGSGQLSGDPYIVEVLMHRAQQPEMNLGGYNEFFNSCLDIREGLPLSYSIDEYMDSRKKVQEYRFAERLPLQHRSLKQNKKVNSGTIPQMAESGVFSIIRILMTPGIQNFSGCFQAE
jgi:hypothetical protein